MKASKRVVVGGDGSNESTEAIRWAAQHAASTGAVVEAWTSWNFPALSGIAYDVSNWEPNARETLDISVARALPTGSNDVERYTVQEHPGAALIAPPRAQMSSSSEPEGMAASPECCWALSANTS